jgi:hypothetical protein
MRKILVVVHLEPDFGDHLESLAEEVVEYSEDFDKVINITCAESLSGTEPFYVIKENFFDNREWIWGFDADYHTVEEPDRWVEGKNYISTSGHEWSEILDWMHDLSKRDKYTLVGGARCECLQDIYDIFNHLNLNTVINEKYTY